MCVGLWNPTNRPLCFSAPNFVLTSRDARTFAPVNVRFRAYGSVALKAGVPLKVVSEQLGHASIAITADIYTDVYPELRADAARRINDLLGAARSVP